MEDSQPIRFLALLDGAEPDEAWSIFIGSYHPLILRVVRLFARDDDDSSDCFVFVCAQLRERRCSRLRKFDPDGPAKFSTWLYSVVFNLCRDWRRRRRPSYRPFRSISKLPAFDQEVFHLCFEKHETSAEALEHLRPRFPFASEERLEAAIERLHSRLTSRQRWLLQARWPQLHSLTGVVAGSDEPLELPIPDRDSDPEAIANQRELVSRVGRAVKKLQPADVLLLRLRFEQELTLAEVARLMGMKNPQAVDRQIERILDRLRREIE